MNQGIRRAMSGIQRMRWVWGLSLGFFAVTGLALLATGVGSGQWAIGAPTPSALGSTKIGYVDMQRAVPATGAGKKAKEVMDGEFKKRKETLDKKKADIEKLGQDFEKKKSVLSEEVLGKKRAELDEEMMKFQKTVNENQMELAKREKEVLEPIFEKMKKAIEKVANEKGFSMVLEKQGQNILFAHKDVDLTDDIVKAFEKEK